jgi:hypothetical protein
MNAVRLLHFYIYMNRKKPAHPLGCAGCQQKIIHKNGPDELTFQTKADRI